jgi:uncharacterized membrane protein
MIVLVLVFAGRHAPYLTLDFNAPAVFAPQRLVYTANSVAIITHIAACMVALVIGPLQFMTRLRKRRFLNIHRWMGRLYLIGSASGFYMAWLSFGELAAHLSFGSLAVWWFTTGLMAYRHIRAGHIEAHRQWMIRSYAMTFAAVTLRLWLLLFIFGFRVAYEEAFVAVSWVCWIWNIPAAEWLISASRAEHSVSASPEPAVV